MDIYVKLYGDLSGGVTKIGLAKGVPHSIPWFETSFSQVAHGNRLRPIPFLIFDTQQTHTLKHGELR